MRLTNDRRYRNTPIPHRSPRTKVPRGTNTGRLSVRSFHRQLSRSSQHAFPSCDRRPNSPEYNAVHQVVTVPYPNVTTPGSISVSAQSQEDRVRGEAHSAPFTDPLLFASSLTLPPDPSVPFRSSHSMTALHSPNRCGPSYFPYQSQFSLRDVSWTEYRIYSIRASRLSDAGGNRHRCSNVVASVVQVLRLDKVWFDAERPNKDGTSSAPS